VNILNLLTHMAHHIPDEGFIKELIKTQPENIRHAIQSKNNETFKLCLSDQQCYATIVKVTIY
jgi:hypothetical protein